MTEENTPEKKKRPRARITRPAQTAEPVASTQAPTKENDKKNGVVTIRARSLQNKLSNSAGHDRTEFLKHLLHHTEAVCARNFNKVTKMLLDLKIPAEEKARISDIRFSDYETLADSVNKYRHVFERQLVVETAKKYLNDITDNVSRIMAGEYFPDTPQDPATRLELAEKILQLALESPKKLNNTAPEKLVSKIMPEIAAKDSRSDSAVSGFLRCMAAGKFYAPVSNNRNNLYKLSDTFKAFWQKNPNLEQTNKPKYQPEEYLFFDLGADGKPLSPQWYAVRCSKNFRKIAHSVAQKLAAHNISPEQAYKLNSYDIAFLLGNNGSERCRDTPFAKLSPNVNDSPYQEFTQTMGYLLTVGQSDNSRPSKEDINIWKKFFATKEEVAEYENHGDDMPIIEFRHNAQKIYQTLKQECASNNIDNNFMSSWIEDLITKKNVSTTIYNNNFGTFPAKIDIHHNDRLSEASNCPNLDAAILNDPNNYSLMIQYLETSLDIHGDKHKGESANFYIKDYESNSRTYKNSNLPNAEGNYLVATSEMTHLRRIKMHCCEDYDPSLANTPTYPKEKTAQRQVSKVSQHSR